jgi:hypothetical protein
MGGVAVRETFRNPRYGALQGVAWNRGHYGAGSADLCSSIRRRCPDLRVFLDTIGEDSGRHANDGHASAQSRQMFRVPAQFRKGRGEDVRSWR